MVESNASTCANWLTSNVGNSTKVMYRLCMPCHMTQKSWSPNLNWQNPKTRIWQNTAIHVGVPPFVTRHHVLNTKSLFKHGDQTPPARDYWSVFYQQELQSLHQPGFNCYAREETAFSQGLTTLGGALLWLGYDKTQSWRLWMYTWRFSLFSQNKR